MIKLFLALILATSTGLAQCRTMAAVVEEECLLHAESAGEYAIRRNDGMPLSELIKLFDRLREDAKTLAKYEKRQTDVAIKKMESIAKYVYVMGHDVATSKKLVYMKCKAGEYE